MTGSARPTSSPSPCSATVGIAGAIAWLLYTDKPVVNLRVFKDRNFAVGCVVIFSIGAILYSSAVLIPQLAQQVLGYTATLAGLLLSPGALVIDPADPGRRRVCCCPTCRRASSSPSASSPWAARSPMRTA